jgi:hypothetical protein
MKSILYVQLILLSALFSCSKGNDHTEETGTGEVVPVKRSFGNPIAQPVSKEIGAAGGSLESADGKLTLQIPAGAVTSTHLFSIQPIENTLPGSQGKSFRLLPEGIEFNKPVTISYALEESELKESAAEAMYLAYQKKDGYYYLASNTTVDLTNRKLSVQSNHFSDWGIAELFKITADTNQVATGGKAQLKLQWYLGSLLESLTGDQPIGNLEDYDGYVSKVSWSLATGSGNIRADGIHCTYTAPGQIPAVNPALVSVSVPLTLYDDKRKGQLILTEPITTTGDEYVIFNLDGQTFVNLPPDQNGEKSTRMEVDNFYLSASMNNDHGIYLLIPIGQDAKMGTGSYPYGDQEKEAYIELSTPEDLGSYITHKKDCEYCDQVFSSGSIKITKIGAVGDYVEGTFKADLWWMGKYAPPKHTIEGKFRVKREM